MAMSKKDYEAVAFCIRVFRSEREQQEDPDSVILLDRVSNLLAVAFAADNPRFSRERFLAACRGEDSKDSAGRKVRYANR